jgi:predicted transposase
MITLQCQIEFQNKQDKEAVLDLMRRFSSAMRYAYQRLLEGKKKEKI